MKSLLAFLAGLVLASVASAQEPPRFPFVLPWDDAAPAVTDMSALLEKPAGLHGFVQARGGHLYAGERRIRFLGVNTVFGANFPSHEEGEKIAARMAKFGIGCVRFHHMDWRAAPDGIWSADLRTFDPAQLDRLDYFIAQLKARGIYADLNLHVSRAYPGMPAWGPEGEPHFFKGVDLFYPPMLEMQRAYARDLLRHVNPYTGAAYADEPAVALVEINNEDGLLSEWWSGQLDAMPEPYRVALEGPWNRWLQARHPTQAALEKVWNVTTEALGGEMLRDGNFANGLGFVWNLEQHSGAKATAAKLPEADGGLRVSIENTGDRDWCVQLAQSRLALVRGKSYTLAFRARCSGSPRTMQAVVSQAHSPWRELWSGQAEVASEWREFHFTFQIQAGDTDARVVLSRLGEAGSSVDFANVSLRTGGRFGLGEGERLGALPMFRKSGFALRTPAAQRDWMAFLWETEEAYWTGMARFLKEELKTRSLLVGTAAEYSTPPIQARLDVVDAHAYWQHPRFPGRSWDSENWDVPSLSMAGAGDGGVLPGLALRRVEGRPFICTEYNAPAPNWFQAETFPLVCAFAGLQDWDAVFAFAYSHRHGDWDSRRLGGFFDIDQNPAKLATLPASAALFVRGDMPRAAAACAVPLSTERALELCRQRGTWWNLEALGLPQSRVFSAALGLKPGDSAASSAALPAASGTGSPQFTWDAGHRRVTVDTPRCKALIGPGTSEPVALGEVTAGARGWAVLTLTAMDGPDFHSPGRVLISAVASVENTGMRWKNEASVGRDWGKAPTLAEGVSARVTLPVAPSRLKAWALDERGRRGKAIPLQNDGPRAALELGPQYRTLWYEVEIGGGSGY